MLLKTEGKVERFIKLQVEKVREGVEALREAVFAYLDKEKEKFELMAELTDRKETEVDKVKREAEVLLYRGAHLPIYREDFTTLMELIDNIADDAEKVSDFLRMENPKILPQWKDKIREIAQKTWESFLAFEDCFLLLYEDMERAFSTTHKVEDLEKEIDRLQDTLIREIFQSELSLAEKIHLRELVIKLGYVSDSAENASDKVATMAVKRRF